MLYSEQIRQKIRTERGLGSSFWRVLSSSSEDYKKTLELDADSVDWLHDHPDRSLSFTINADDVVHPFLVVTVDSQRFALSCRHILSSRFNQRGGWETIIVAYCMSDNSLNETFDDVSYIKKEWHKKIIYRLLRENVRG